VTQKRKTLSKITIKSFELTRGGALTLFKICDTIATMQVKDISDVTQ